MGDIVSLVSFNALVWSVVRHFHNVTIAAPCLTVWLKGVKLKHLVGQNFKLKVASQH